MVSSSDDSSTDSGTDSGTDSSTDDDNKVVSATSEQFVRSKRLWEDVDEETKPKIIKDSKGARRGLRAGDFDDITKDVLTMATSIYRCLVVTQEPFPETLIVETQLAKHAWRGASDAAGLTVQLTPSLVKMVSSQHVMFTS